MKFRNSCDYQHFTSKKMMRWNLQKKEKMAFIESVEFSRIQT